MRARRRVPFGLPQLLTTAVCTRCGTARDVQRWSSGPIGGVSLPMIKKRKDSVSAHERRPAGTDPASRLRSVNLYLEKNFPDFFAEARFQIGDDDYFLYARFGQYLA